MYPLFSLPSGHRQKAGGGLPEPPLVVRCRSGVQSYAGWGDTPLSYLDNVGMLRDIFSAIFPDLSVSVKGRLRER